MYAKGFGVRDVNTKAPVDADTVFQLASVSKPIGSTVVAELIGEGEIAWDSKLSTLDPTSGTKTTRVINGLILNIMITATSA